MRHRPCRGAALVAQRRVATAIANHQATTHEAAVAEQHALGEALGTAFPYVSFGVYGTASGYTVGYTDGPTRQRVEAVAAAAVGAAKVDVRRSFTNRFAVRLAVAIAGRYGVAVPRIVIVEGSATIDYADPVCAELDARCHARDVWRRKFAAAAEDRTEVEPWPF